MPHGTCRINADLDRACYDYFFRGIFAGEVGPKQAMVCTFFAAIHQACLTEGISPVWDQENEQRVATVLSRINFADLTGHDTSLVAAFDAGRASVGAASGPSPASSRPPRARRTPRSPSIPQTQPDGEGHE